MKAFSMCRSYFKTVKRIFLRMHVRHYAKTGTKKSLDFANKISGSYDGQVHWHDIAKGCPGLRDGMVCVLRGSTHYTVELFD